MAAPLAEKACTPCRGGVLPLAFDEAERFREALRFVEHAGALAESEQDHPDISFG